MLSLEEIVVLESSLSNKKIGSIELVSPESLPRIINLKY